jgi:heme exporter protein D
MVPAMNTDLSQFYDHPFSYEGYVYLAYGAGLTALFALTVWIITRHIRIIKKAKTLGLLKE